jgi:succinate-acetate transporter protein
MSSKCTNPLAQTGPGYGDGHGLHHVEKCQQSLDCRVTGRAFGGALQPGLWKPYEHRKLANPVPLGLCGFATSCFVLSCVNLQARGVEAPNIAVPLALVYGGFCQVLAGMW